MKRIQIIGTSCAGKTTLARKLSEILNIPHIELDQLYWKPDWEESDRDDFKLKIQELVKKDKWIICGNYSFVQPITLQRATTVIWLNYSFVRIFSRGLIRTIKRVFNKEKLFAGNVETFSKSFMSFDSILIWIIKTFWKNKRKYKKMFNIKDYNIQEYIELRTFRETERFLNSFTGHKDHALKIKKSR